MLDDDLPVWVPIPALAEIQIALEKAVAEVTQLEGYELKRIMRTGTVATIDNRNWELRDQSGPVRRLSQSRAVALDMECATIAANGFRFRVPYGTLLCVSRQAPAWRVEAARHGVRLLQDAGQPPPADRHPRDGAAARHADRAASQPETAQFRGNGLPLTARKRRQMPVFCGSGVDFDPETVCLGRGPETVGGRPPFAGGTVPMTRSE